MGVLKIVLALAVVLLIIFLLARILRSLHGVKAAGNSDLKLLSMLSVGGRERVAVVRHGDTELLIGISANGIARLHQRDVSAAKPHNPADSKPDIERQQRGVS